jgi:signal transduction histidine kinase
VSNEAGDEEPSARKFMPRSIFERVQMLGGNTFIERRPDNRHTVIHVSIPM